MSSPTLWRTVVDTASPLQVATGTTGFATLSGTVREPVVALNIHPKMPYPPDPRMGMKDWVKGTLHGRWDPQERVWRVTSLGPAPSRTLAEAGIVLAPEAWDARPEVLQSAQSLDELAAPIAKLHSNGRLVMVRHRLTGYDATLDMLGPGATWDRDRRLFWTYVGDVLDRYGNVRDGVVWPRDAVTRAFEMRTHQGVPPQIAPLAAHLGGALGIEDIASSEVDRLAPGGFPPATPGREPYEYQKAGVLAICAGRRGLFDEPGVGKTLTALTAVRVMRARRTIVVCPPLLNSNWAREAELAGIDSTVVFRTGRRKEPELPDVGMVIIADSTLAARPETAARLHQWGADMMIVDEAHRLMTIGSRRSEAVLNLGVSVREAPIAVTGTPLFASPHQLAPLLELTRTLSPVFGGRSTFLEDFCRQDRFGKWHARASALPRLKVLLENHVWIRRHKRDVLPQLPEKTRCELVVDVPLTEYRKAHRDVIAKVHAWVTWLWNQEGRRPDLNDIEQYARESSFEIVSQLHRAAGLAKIPAVIDRVAEHLDSTGFDEDAGVRRWRRPLIVWTHHIAVAEQLLAGLDGAEAIIGTTTDAERDRTVERFQDGQVPVLVAAITKAGVGLTLTRSSDAYFCESHWTPALIVQAEDRCHRVGQTNAPRYTTFIAPSTLDEPMQKVLAKKSKVLEATLGTMGDSVAVRNEDDTAALTEIATTIIQDAVKTWKQPT